MIGIHTTDFVYLTGNNTLDVPLDVLPGGTMIELRIAAMMLLPGAYSFRVWIGRPDGRTSFDVENLSTFQVTADSSQFARQEVGVVHMDAQWNFEGAFAEKTRQAPRLLA
jgi:hypothetical protein